MESDPHSMTQYASLHLLHSCAHIIWCRYLLLSLVSALPCWNFSCSRLRGIDQWGHQVDLETSQATGTSSVFRSLDKCHRCQWCNSLTGTVLKTNWGPRPFNQAIKLIWRQARQLALLCLWIFWQMSPLSMV